MAEELRKPDVRRDSLLAHCIARAVIAEEGGPEAASEKYARGPNQVSKWVAMKTVAKVTNKASRVAAFIVLWAVTMIEEESDEITITEYQRYWNEGERQTYRLQGEFRELWPEFETPNEVARQLRKHIDSSLSRREIALLPTKLMVRA
ncbi:MAG: hypothetical protein U0R50_17655 [Gaiellales bacterium]